MGKMEWKSLMLPNQSLISWKVLHCCETEHRGKYPHAGKKEKIRPEVKERGLQKATGKWYPSWIDVTVCVTLTYLSSSTLLAGKCI